MKKKMLMFIVGMTLMMVACSSETIKEANTIKDAAKGNVATSEETKINIYLGAESIAKIPMGANEEGQQVTLYNRSLRGCPYLYVS